MKSAKEIMQIIETAEVKDSYEDVLEREHELTSHLVSIREHYAQKTACYSSKCEAVAQQLLMIILTHSDLKEIHSARYRVKTIESLLVKYIKKKSLLPEVPGTDYNIEKYRFMNRDNYYKIITDLIGIRILIRYQQQWEVVHKWIWSNFYKSDEHYIKNWLEDYPAGVEDEDFIVEKPKLYLRDENDLLMYQKFGKDVFEHHVSKEGYNCIHYLLWFNGKYVEVQVRTVYDEAWSECTHDLVYKCKTKTKREELKNLSKCLAIQTQAASMIADTMFEKVHVEEKKPEEISYSTGNTSVMQEARYEKLQKRILNMKVPKEQKAEFDSVIDGLM